MTLKTRALKFAVSACAAAALILPAASAQLAGGPQGGGVILFDQSGFSGEAVQIDSAVSSLSDARFNDKASSIQVLSGRWEVCTNGNFGGRCEIIRNDNLDLQGIGLNNNISSIRPAGSRRGTGPRATNGGVRSDFPIGPNVNDSGPITLFSEENFRGEVRSFDRDVRRLSSVNFNDRARSVRVISGVWLLCEDANFGGRCEYVDRDIPDLRRLGLRGNISSISLSPYDVGPGAHAITLFQHDNFGGAFLGFDEEVRDLGQYNYNDTASSIRITSGRWLICEDRDFRGACEVVRGDVRDLSSVYLNDRITSLRQARSGDRSRPRANGYGYGDNDYPRGGNGGYGPGSNYGGTSGGFEGEDTVFFPRPTDRFGDPIRNGSGSATRFCRDIGLRGAAYKGDGRYLEDVLCEK